MTTIHKIQCSEIWGGNHGDELAVETSGIRASLFSRPCDGGKGGDIYYLSVCGSDLLTRIAIADVVGHGEAVSETSGWLYDSLAARMNSADGNEVLSDLNRATSERGLEAMTTAVIAAFYRASSQFFFSYAGHHQILHLALDASEWQTLDFGVRGHELTGLPLGVDEDCKFQQQDTPVAIGDKLFLYTDGLIEAHDSNDEQFGFSRLLSVLNQVARLEISDIRQRVLDELLQHTGGSLGHDDVTFMAIEITADSTHTV